MHELREMLIGAFGGQDMTRHDRRFFSHVLSNKIGADPAVKWLVIDVGGHNGWFIKVLRRFCPEGNFSIRCYEPLASKQAGLRALGGDLVVINKAIGAKPGTLAVHEYGSTGLSSVYEFAPTYAYAECFDSTLRSTVDVETVTLDGEFRTEGIPILLKIDVQGYEAEVLKGATAILKSGRVKVVILELMTVEKYAGAITYGPIFDMLHAAGFTLFDLNCTYYEAGSGKLTEFDAAFERP